MMKVQGCFSEGGKGAWLDYEVAGLTATGHPDESQALVEGIKLPDGMSGLRVITDKEIWTFRYHPTYGVVPRLVNDGGEIREVWPTNREVGGTWEVGHVLPDGNVIPMMYVEPALSFEMGDDESPSRRKVAVPASFMAKTPTTVRQWNYFAAAKGKDLKAGTVVDKSGKTVDLTDHPVVEVSYWDSCEFAEWAGVGLPSEEEWERAARGNDGRKFPWGNEPPTLETCHSSVQVQQERTDGVFNRPKGASPYGLLDMSGNVWEWTNTIHK